MAETDVKASNAEKKVDGKCPDGYTEVWTWCFKKSVIDKLAKPLDDIKIPSFTDPSCEAALAALKGIESTVNSLMQLPKKYLSMLGSLLNYPFDVASNMLNAINKAMDQVSKAIDNLLKGVTDASGLNDLTKAMNNILSCSFLADSGIGKLAAEILDALKSGLNVSSLLGQLKNMLNSTAQDALNNLKKTPTQALNNINNAIDNLIKQLGLDDIMKNMKKLEKCVDSLCKAFKNLEDFKDRLPSSADDILKSAGMAWDSATQSVTNAAMTIAGQATSAASTVTSVVTSAATGSITSTVTTVAGNAVSGVVTTATSVASGATSAVSTAVSTATSGVASSVTGAVANAASSLVGSSASSVVGTAASVATGLNGMSAAYAAGSAAGSLAKSAVLGK